MPRRPRELVDGGIYHIFNRGNDRRNLFSEPEDYQCFLNHLGNARSKLSIELYHYCLMPNHFHLLLKIQKRNDLAKLMHHLQLSYARYFKKTRTFVGHIFQERFRSPRIYEESYYLQCGRYIERNPVKAKLVEEAAEYPYSSAKFYVTGTKDPLLTPNPYYAQMEKTEGERRQRYREFLSFDEPYAQMLDAALVKV
ncbi:MAG: transposase [Elusimicrobia bacterium]|nr:transposase [Elusimicrobiota bacterium]